MVRKTITTKGKQISFVYSGRYVTPENYNADVCDFLFNGMSPDVIYCVAYTTIKDDIRLNSITLERERYGVVGYQNFSFFTNEDDAKRDYDNSSKLTSKLGILAYADVFLFKKISK